MIQPCLRLYKQDRDFLALIGLIRPSTLWRKGTSLSLRLLHHRLDTPDPGSWRATFTHGPRLTVLHLHGPKKPVTTYSTSTLVWWYTRLLDMVMAESAVLTTRRQRKMGRLMCWQANKDQVTQLKMFGRRLGSFWVQSYIGSWSTVWDRRVSAARYNDDTSLGLFDISNELDATKRRNLWSHFHQIGSSAVQYGGLCAENQYPGSLLYSIWIGVAQVSSDVGFKGNSTYAVRISPTHRDYLPNLSGFVFIRWGLSWILCGSVT